MWRNLESLPEHDGRGWVVWKRGRFASCIGLDDAKEAVQRWNPVDPMLIGAPGSVRFLPPVCIPALRTSIVGRLRKNLQFALGAWATLGLLLTVIAVTGAHSAYYGAFAAICLLLAGTLFADYVVATRSANAIASRAIFFRWLQIDVQPRIGFLFWTVVMACAGLVQLYLTDRLGSLDLVVERYGIMFPAVREGQFWRLPIGVFFHSGLLHYFNNLFLLQFIGSVMWGLLGARRTIFIFIAGCVAGALFQMWFGPVRYDSFLGVSAGIFSLYGTLITMALIDRRLLPKGFVFLIGGVVITSGVGAELLSTNAASIGHIVGITIGILVGLSLHWFRSVNSDR